MAELFAVIGPILSVANTVLGFVGQMQQAKGYEQAAAAQIQLGQYQQAVANRQAQALEQQAGQERAVSQREAIEQRRQGRFVSSRAQAIAAASGAGALDPTIIDILGGIEAETGYRALSALAAGEERGRGLEYNAVLARSGGAADAYASGIEAQRLRGRAQQSRYGAFGTLATGGMSLFEKYGGADADYSYG